MSRGLCVFLALLLIVAYGIGLFLLVNNLDGENIGLAVVGLLCCGLPTGIVFLIVAHWLFDSKTRNRTRRNDGGRRLGLFLLSIVLGIVVTPILIIVLIVRAIKGNKPQE